MVDVLPGRRVNHIPKNARWFGELLRGYPRCCPRSGDARVEYTGVALLGAVARISASRPYRSLVLNWLWSMTLPVPHSLLSIGPFRQ